MHYGITLTEINNAIDDGPLFLAPTALHANTLQLKHHQFDFLCISYKLLM